MESVILFVSIPIIFFWIGFLFGNRVGIKVRTSSAYQQQFATLSIKYALNRFEPNAQAETLKLYVTARALGHDPGVVEDIFAGLVKPFASDPDQIARAEEAVAAAKKPSGGRKASTLTDAEEAAKRFAVSFDAPDLATAKGRISSNLVARATDLQKTLLAIGKVQTPWPGPIGPGATLPLRAPSSTPAPDRAPDQEEKPPEVP